MVRPMGLTAALSGTMRAHVVKVLDLLLAEVKASFGAEPESVERDLVDEVRRWAARREEALFPSGRHSCGDPECREGEAEPDPPTNEPSNGHGKWVCPECGAVDCVPSLCLRGGGDEG